QLQHVPNFVVTKLADGLVGELSERPTHGLIESSAVIWHKSDSCAAKLLSDITDDIHQVCTFVARKEQIEPSWLRLSEHVFVLSNFTDAQLVCGPNRTVQPSPFTAPCTPCILRIACGCSLRTPSGLSALDSARREHNLELADCNINAQTRTPVLHTVNLAVLQHF